MTGILFCTAACFATLAHLAFRAADDYEHAATFELLSRPERRRAASGHAAELAGAGVDGGWCGGWCGYGGAGVFGGGVKRNIVGPMTVHGYEIPADTVAQAINWMTDGGGFEAVSLRNFLVARWHFVECAGDYKDEIIYIAADRIIGKAKRDGLIEFDSFHRVWRKVQK